MQGADYDFSKSFRDLEPTRWKCNSVQLLCCLVLNKQVCVYATPSIILKEATDVLDQREDR